MRGLQTGHRRVCHARHKDLVFAERLTHRIDRGRTIARCVWAVVQTDLDHLNLRVGIALVHVDPLGAAFVFEDQLGVIHAHEVEDGGV